MGSTYPPQHFPYPSFEQSKKIRFILYMYLEAQRLLGFLINYITELFRPGIQGVNLFLSSIIRYELRLPTFLLLSNYELHFLN